jgi:hypothetical protein
LKAIAEGFSGIPVLLEQGEETSLADPEHPLHLGSFGQSLAVSFEQHLDLIVREPPVQLSHFVPP